MSDTISELGTSRARRLLTAARKAPRQARIAAAAGLITLAGTAALVAVPAAANATTTVNPNCPLPATQPWQYDGSITSSLTRPGTNIAYNLSDNYWETTYNGVFYTGVTLTVRPNTTLTPSAATTLGACVAGDGDAYPG